VVQSGSVEICKTEDGDKKIIGVIGRGGTFGEMALINRDRTADVWADTTVQCLEVPLKELVDYDQLFPTISLHITRNLSALLARRLVLANAKVDLLSSY